MPHVSNMSTPKSTNLEAVVEKARLYFDSTLVYMVSSKLLIYVLISQICNLSPIAGCYYRSYASADHGVCSLCHRQTELSRLEKCRFPI